MATSNNNSDKLIVLQGLENHAPVELAEIQQFLQTNLLVLEVFWWSVALVVFACKVIPGVIYIWHRDRTLRNLLIASCLVSIIAVGLRIT